MKSKKALSLVLALTLVASCLAIGLSMPASAGYPGALKFRPDGTFKILQIADMQNRATLDANTQKMLQAMLRKHQPDLVVLTGDNIAGLLGGGGLSGSAAASIGNFMKVFDLYKVPVAAVFGNHDDEVDTKANQLTIYQSYSTCLMVKQDPSYPTTITSSIGNYNLPITSSDGQRMAYNLWLFDAGQSSSATWDGVHKDALDWYVWKSNQLRDLNNGQLVPSVVFQHIVVRQIEDALVQFNGWKNYPNTTYNFFGEAPCPPNASRDYGQFGIHLAQGDVKAMFFGHDHQNNFDLPWQGIRLIGTGGIGSAGGAAKNRGCRIITLHEDNPNQIDLLTEFINDQGTMPAVETAHSFGPWQERTPATCTEPNEEFRKCANDYFEETRSTAAALGHQFVTPGTPVPPTCTEQGYTPYACTCGKTENKDFTGPLDHLWSEDDWAVYLLPTETAKGIEERFCQRGCGERRTREIPELSHEHNFTAGFMKSATCTMPGYTIYTCTCGATENREPVDPLGHLWGEDDWVTVDEPTEAATGLEEHYCQRGCGLNETRNIPKLGHTFVAGTPVPPTCTAQGYAVYRCDCGETETKDFVDPLSHLWGEDDWVTVDEPTEAATGLEEHYCQRGCGLNETRTIPKLGHSYVAGTPVPPTCTEQGYTLYTCSGCGDSEKRDFVAAPGHYWGPWEVTSPTVETRVCLRNGCGASETRTHEHKDTANVTPPTCTKGGYTTYTCACGNTHVGDPTPSLGHLWADSWTEVDAPTEAAPGLEERYCQRPACAEKQQREIPKLPATEKNKLVSRNGIIIVDEYLHYIYGFGPGVTWSNMMANYLRTEGDSTATPATQGETYVGTGFQLRFYPDPKGSPEDYIMYTFVLFGDTGDGWVNASDAAECLNMVGTHPTAMTPQMFAMAFNNDSEFYAAPTADTRTIISNYARGNAYIDFGDYAAMRYRVVKIWFDSHA